SSALACRSRSGYAAISGRTKRRSPAERAEGLGGSPSGAARSPWGAARSPRACLAPYRAWLAPDRACLAPDRAWLVPDRAPLTPHRAPPAPDRARPAPDRACLVPHRARPAPPGCTSLPIGRGSLLIGRGLLPIGRALLPIGRGLPPIVRGSLPIIRSLRESHKIARVRRRARISGRCMRSKRDVLDQLNRDELLDAVDQAGLEVRDRRVRADLVDVLAGSRKVPLAEVLGRLPRTRLKEICVALGLDDSGREKALLIERLAGPGRAAAPDPPPASGGEEAGPVKVEPPPATAVRSRSTGGPPLGLEAKLWAAADALRNNMDAAEYKHVVLGLIFLK